MNPSVVIPSVKGQITIPTALRKKYGIGKDTPIVVEDQGNGVLILKVKKMIDADSIEYYETPDSFGLRFKDGIDPQALIDAIDKIDGQNWEVFTETK